MKKHTDFWKSITSDHEVLRLVHGVKIDFTMLPDELVELPPYYFRESKARLIDAEIEKMLKKGVIQETVFEECQVVSNIFTRDKKDGSLRVILDLSNLNMHIKYQHFKMDTLESALNLVTEGCNMASIDWKDAYYSVSIDKVYSVTKWFGLCTTPLH